MISENHEQMFSLSNKEDHTGQMRVRVVKGSVYFFVLLFSVSMLYSDVWEDAGRAIGMTKDVVGILGAITRMGSEYST